MGRLIACLSLLSLFTLFILGVDCYWTGMDPPEKRVIAGKIEDKPNVFYNQAHLEIPEFIKKTLLEIAEDGKLPKKIYFHYGERLNRRFEIKMIVVYWMREEPKDEKPNLFIYEGKRHRMREE